MREGLREENFAGFFFSKESAYAGRSSLSRLYNTGVKALSHLGKGEEQLYRRNCSMCYGISSVFPPPPSV